jgi:hypothetical protein
MMRQGQWNIKAGRAAGREIAREMPSKKLGLLRSTGRTGQKPVITLTPIGCWL